MAKNKGLTFYRRKKKISTVHVREVFSWLFGIAAAVFIAVVLNVFLGVTTRVVGVSMEPTLYNGQKIFINSFLYLISTPQRGDVVVFLPNGNHNSHYYVKRVVGLPGETIQIMDGSVYINGSLLEEDEAFDKMIEAGIAQNGLTLAADEFFVLGDNRNSSEDSRSGNVGAVRKDDVIGKAWFRMATGDESMGLIE